MKQLALCIPTCDRPKHVKEFFQILIKGNIEKWISIYIYDASTNQVTKNIVDNFIRESDLEIYYKYLPEERVGSKRTFDLMNDPNEEYVWLCGDKFVIKPENFNLIRLYISLNYDLITIYDRGEGLINYTNYKNMIRDCAWFMTHMGAVIIKRELLINYDYEWFCKGAYNSFWHFRLYAYAVIKADFRGIFLNINKESFRVKNKNVVESGSEQRILEVWIKGWYKAVMDLPKEYDSVKADILKSAPVKMNTLTFRGLYNYSDQLTIKNIIYNWNYISKLTNHSFLYFLLLTSLPQKVKKILLNL